MARTKVQQFMVRIDEGYFLGGVDDPPGTLPTRTEVELAVDRETWPVDGHVEVRP